MQPSRIVPVNVQLQPIVTRSLVFSRASGGLLIFIVGSDWLLTTSSFYRLASAISLCSK